MGFRPTDSILDSDFICFPGMALANAIALPKQKVVIIVIIVSQYYHKKKHEVAGIKGLGALLHCLAFGGP